MLLVLAQLYLDVPAPFPLRWEEGLGRRLTLFVNSELIDAGPACRASRFEARSRYM